MHMQVSLQQSEERARKAEDEFRRMQKQNATLQERKQKYKVCESRDLTSRIIML